MRVIKFLIKSKINFTPLTSQDIQYKRKLKIAFQLIHHNSKSLQSEVNTSI